MDRKVIEAPAPRKARVERSQTSAAGTARPLVVHVVSTLQVGGAERLVLDLAPLQREHGADVRVLSLGASRDPLVVEAARENVPVVSVGDYHGLWRQHQVIRRELITGRPAAIHLHTPVATKVLAPWWPAIRARIVYTRHGEHPLHQPVWRLTHWWARRFVHQVAFVSEEGRAAFTRLHGEWRSPHLVVENGVRLDVPQHLEPVEPGRLHLGSVGRLVALKGQRRLLDAVAGFPPEIQSQLCLHFFGDGEERAALERHAAEQVRHAEVIWHGNVLDRDEIYRQMDVLVVASETEGRSLAILEAMARGIPVIATDVGGNPVLVSPGETGLLVRNADPDAFRNAIEALFNDRHSSARMSQAARERVTRGFSLNDTALRYLQLYGLPSGRK